MNEVIIDPSVPLSDAEWAAALERKRQMLLRGEYRPAKMAVPWPKPDAAEPPMPDVHADVPAGYRGYLRVVK